MLSRLCQISWARLGRKCFIALLPKKYQPKHLKSPEEVGERAKLR